MRYPIMPVTALSADITRDTGSVQNIWEPVWEQHRYFRDSGSAIPADMKDISGRQYRSGEDPGGCHNAFQQ